MKRSILVGCLVLGLVGCATERGGVGTAYETSYGSDWSTSDPYLYTYDSIYPVRRQPSINGAEMGGVRPLIDPSRQYGMGYWREDVRSSREGIRSAYERENFDRVAAPRDPFLH